LGRQVTADVVLGPAAADVPRQCRNAVQAGTAFTCPTDDRIYLTAPYIDRLKAAQPTANASYRFASTLGHEMGHVVQFTEHAPLINKDQPTEQESQQIEQQADCLSGVWAHGAGLDTDRFVTAADEVFALIDNDFERRTHGDPQARIAAIRRGVSGGTPAACGLTVS
jgi:predicted metalloprotease